MRCSKDRFLVISKFSLFTFINCRIHQSISLVNRTIFVSNFKTNDGTLIISLPFILKVFKTKKQESDKRDVANQ